MTLQEFLSRCSECEQSRNPAAGLVVCDELLASGAQGRVLAAALRYKAVFLLHSSQAWANEATVYLREALPLLKQFPADQAPVLSTLVGAYAMFGAFDKADQYARQFLRLVDRHQDPEIRQYAGRVWFNLGYAYDVAGQFEPAAQAYTRAYEEALVAPERFNPGMAAHNLVQMLLELGRIDDAFAMLHASRRHLDEAQVGAFMQNQEALCHLAAGQLEAAAAACRAALDHPACPDRVRAEVYFTQARLAAAQGQEQDRDHLVAQALEIAVRLPHPRLRRKIELFAVSVRNREEVPN